MKACRCCCKLYQLAPGAAPSDGEPAAAAAAKGLDTALAPGMCCKPELTVPLASEGCRLLAARVAVTCACMDSISFECMTCYMTT